MPSPLTKNKFPATATKFPATATKLPATATKRPATATKRPATATKRTPSSKAPSRVKRGGFDTYEAMMDAEFERIMKDTPQVIEVIKKNNTRKVLTLNGFIYKVNEEEAHKQLHALLHKNVSQKMI
jgi:hypothetical protein